MAEVANMQDTEPNEIKLHDFAKHATCERSDLEIIFTAVQETFSKANMPEGQHLAELSNEGKEVCYLLIMEVLLVGTFIVSVDKDVKMNYDGLLPVKTRPMLQVFKQEVLSLTTPPNSQVARPVLEARQKAYLNI